MDAIRLTNITENTFCERKKKLKHIENFETTFKELSQRKWKLASQVFSESSRIGTERTHSAGYFC